MPVSLLGLRSGAEEASFNVANADWSLAVPNLPAAASNLDDECSGSVLLRPALSARVTAAPPARPSALRSRRDVPLPPVLDILSVTGEDTETVDRTTFSLLPVVDVGGFSACFI